jgi:hypothetical protein
LATDENSVRQIQQRMLASHDVVAKQSPPGVLIWPYHDVPPTADYFAAANWAAITGVYIPNDHVPDFDAEHAVDIAEIERVNERVKKLKNVQPAAMDEKSRPKTRRELVLALFGKANASNAVD